MRDVKWPYTGQLIRHVSQLWLVDLWSLSQRSRLQFLYSDTNRIYPQITGICLKQTHNYIKHKLYVELFYSEIYLCGVWFKNACKSTMLSVNILSFEPVHEISNNMVSATSKASDQPAHMRSLIRAFASRLSIL